MRTLSHEELVRASADSIPVAVNESAMGRFLENMSDAGCLALFRWARWHAPNLLYALTVSFLTQAPSSELNETLGQRSSPAKSVDGTTMISKSATLRAVERQYIAQAISESRTLREAAVRLGVAETTLWRKRKLYALKSERRLKTPG